jgi:hypothetical protein
MGAMANRGMSQFINTSQEEKSMRRYLLSFNGVLGFACLALLLGLGSPAYAGPVQISSWEYPPDLQGWSVYSANGGQGTLTTGTTIGATDGNEPMTPEEQAKAKAELEKTKKTLEDLLAAVEKAANDLNDMISKEKDLKKKATLDESLAQLLDLKIQVQNKIAAVQAALDSITTISQTAIKTLLETITGLLEAVEKIISTLPKIIQAALQAALDITKGVIQGCIDILKVFISGIGDLLKSLWSIPKSFFGWLGLCSATDLNSDGVHQLAMTGGGYLRLTLANLNTTPQIVPFVNISFSVLSEPGSEPNLRRLTVINGTFVATLASFTVNGKVIGPSTVSIDPNITWTGIYDSNDQSLHLPLGGIIVNDYTPISSPMIFSLVAEGPIASMNCTGFSFEPWSLGQASIPQPEYRAVRVGLNPNLTWNYGEWVQNVNGNAVYFGLDFNAVNTAGPNDPNGVYKGRQDVNGYYPGTLGAGATYYWRIDEHNDANVNSPWRGQIWEFTTNDGNAYNPRPADAATVLTQPLQLSWTAGEWAATTNGQRVYFGTSYTQVNNATTATPIIYRGAQTGATYNLTNLTTNWYGPLVPDINYYWRIDEVNGATTWKGPVWSVTTTEYITIDDFDGYNHTDELQANWQTAYDTNCGSTVGSGGRSLVWDTAGKYMKFTYINDGSREWLFSETKRSYSGGTSFTGGGVISPSHKALRIDYRGTALNAAHPIYDRMYVAIEDTAGNVSVYDNPDANAAQVSSWTSWYSKLTDINAVGNTNLEAISGFAIGFGVRCNAFEPGGGDGNVMFDNIRLYNAVCVPQYGPTADLNNDCYVDLVDLNVLSQKWLTTDIGADIYLDGIVNFRDLVVMCDQWHTQILWP